MPQAYANQVTRFCSLAAIFAQYMVSPSTYAAPKPRPELISGGDHDPCLGPSLSL